jgi:3-vinyl bacteriochlorophyllide hydratase
MVSMAVLVLHSAYVVMLFANWGSLGQQVAVALAAYAAYVINAAQFVYKLRLARLGSGPQPLPMAASA